MYLTNAKMIFQFETARKNTHNLYYNAISVLNTHLGLPIGMLQQLRIMSPILQYIC